MMKHFFNKIKKLLEINNLEDVCKLILSPLEKIIINNKSYLWYKLDFIKLIEKIDILLVDGPHVYIQEQSRFPALLLLKDKLNQNTAIYLDDGKREDEKKIIKLWQDLFPCLNFQYIDTIKGTWKIYKNLKIYNELIKLIKEKNKLFLVIGPNKNWTFGVSRIIKITEYISKKNFNVIYLCLNDDSLLTDYEYKNNILFISVNAFNKILSDKFLVNEIQNYFSECKEKYLLIEMPTDLISNILNFFIENNFFYHL